MNLTRLIKKISHKRCLNRFTILILLFLVVPCSSMEEKKAFYPRLSAKEIDIRIHVERLSQVDNDVEANAIILSIPDNYREEVLNRLQNHSSPSSSFITGDAAYTPTRVESPENVELDENKRLAINLYARAQQYEAEGKKEEAAKLWLKSAKMDFIPSALSFLNQELVKITNLIDKNKILLNNQKGEFDNQQGKGKSLRDSLTLETQLLELNVRYADMEEERIRLQNEYWEENKLFSSYLLWSYSNDMAEFAKLDIDEDYLGMQTLITTNLKDEKKAARQIIMLINLIDKKIEQLQRTISILEEKKATLRTKEADHFITEINRVMRNSLIDIKRLRIIFLDDPITDLNMLANEILDCRLLIQSEKTLVRKILRIVRKYTASDYIIFPLITEDIRQVRDVLLERLVEHNYAFAEGSKFLITFSNYFIAAHDKIKILTSLDRLKAQLVILREAERYLQAIENPLEYVKLTRPEKYKSIKDNPQHPNKKALLQRYYEDDPSSRDLGSSLSVKVFLDTLRERATQYTLWLIDNSYHLYKEPSPREEMPLALYGLQRKSRGLGTSADRVAEVSPWVPSLNYFLNLQEGQPYEFVFDVYSLSIYIGTAPCKISDGHCYILGSASINFPCGGSIKRIGNSKFRTDEASGHYGWYWTDKRRFRFLQILWAIGQRHREFQLLHEPWISDEKRAREYPNLLTKILNFQPFGEEDKLPKRDTIFQNMADEELQKYQIDFINKYNCGIYRDKNLKAIGISSVF